MSQTDDDVKKRFFIVLGVVLVVIGVMLVFTGVGIFAAIPLFYLSKFAFKAGGWS